MKISEVAIKRPVTTTMVILLIVLLGFISFSRLNLDLYPDMVYPGAVIFLNYEGVGPEEIENMVTKPLESTVATVTNLKTLTSSSSTGSSMLMAEFNWGTDMDFAVMDMREKIDMVEGYLPDEVTNPIIVKFDPSLMPIMQLGISSDKNLVELKSLIEDKITPRLERLEGVASVSLIGGKDREILISLDQTKLNNYGVSFSNITNILLTENMNVSGGRVSRGNREFLVRVTGKFKSIDEIRKILIPTQTGLISLENIAQVKDTYKEVDSLARLNGNQSIGLLIQKQTDANTVSVSRAVKAEIDNIKKEMNQKVEIVSIFDQAKFIERSIGNVGRNAIFGGILAVLILFIFLRNIRSTLIIATAIPVSIITTFTLIYFGNLTLNMMTLGGLALGVGMLVDSSIVVLENIYRYRAEGVNRVEAARQGSQEVGMAITASTITTIVVFLPIVFVQGLASQLFSELALTVTFSLLASLVISLTLIPVMSSKILKANKVWEKKKTWMDGLRNFYSKTLNWALSHRIVVILVTILALVGSIALFPMIGAEFIPEMDQGEITVNADLPLGTSLRETSRVAAQIEEILMDVPEIKYILANIGGGGFMSNEESPETAEFQIQLIDKNNRNRLTDEIMEELRQKIRIPDVKLSIGATDTTGMGGGKPISIKIKGDNLKTLEDITKKIRTEMEQVSAVREIEDSITEGRPELQITIDRSLASRMGLRVSQIGSAINTAIKGSAITKYEVEGKEYDIRVRLNQEDIKTPEQVKELQISSATGVNVPLNNIASFTVKQGPREILRENQVRYVSISADIYNSDLNTVMKEIQNRVESNVNIPDGYLLNYGGEYEEMTDSFRDLGLAFILAIVLVYMVMASQFESLLHPFVVMFTVPLAVIGVLLGLFLTGNKLSVVSIIGIIMLAGIVVNNAIVLVDYINNLRGKGKLIREAILEAGPVRLRPILMTALTTILGLLPLALGIGEGAEVQSPMAVVVIGGLSVATLLTLYVVPVIYSLFSRMGRENKNNIDKSGSSVMT